MRVSRRKGFMPCLDTRAAVSYERWCYFMRYIFSLVNQVLRLLNNVVRLAISVLRLRR